MAVIDRDGRLQAVLPDQDGRETVAVRFSPDSDRLVALDVAESNDGTWSGRITVWDWRQQRVVQSIETPKAGDVDLDTTGRRVATGFGPPTIWDLETGMRIDLEGSLDQGDVAFSPDGSLLGVPYQATVRLYEAATGQLRQVLRGGEGKIGRLAFSADGSKLAAHGIDGVHVWALDLDELVVIGRRELTRTWTIEECERYQVQASCLP